MPTLKEIRERAAATAMESWNVRYHHALPGWCKMAGLRIREIVECEGGGYMLPQPDAEFISKSRADIVALFDALKKYGQHQLECRKLNWDDPCTCGWDDLNGAKD